MTDASKILLAHHLKTLKLPTFLREYEKVARQCAVEGLDHVKFLTRLVDMELIERERRIKAAKFPATKSLYSFDFKAILKLNMMQVLELARCKWIDWRENVIALGPSGTGKTDLAVGLGFAACQKGMSVAFTTTAALLNEMMEARDGRSLLRLQKQLAAVKLLIIDELGFVPLSKTGCPGNRWGRRLMRHPASEKLEIIPLVEGSHLASKRTLDKLGIPRTTFYRWYHRYLAGGPEAIEDPSPRPSRVQNRISEPVREKVKDLALKECDLSPRELAVRFTDTEKYFVSEASVYRILKSYDLITSPAYVVLSAANKFNDKTTRPNQLWQTDFTYLKVIGWGWFNLSTILDDYSRYIIAWKLCTTMKASDVTDTLDLALQASGCDRATVLHKPGLLSDNGASYISGELAGWLEDLKMDHVRGAPYHPQTEGKIERWHQTLKNRILLENYYLPGDLRQKIDAFVDHYKHRRYHESLQNLTPADVYFGRSQTILQRRERIKRKTIETRRLLHRKPAAESDQSDEPGPLLDQAAICPKTLTTDSLTSYMLLIPKPKVAVLTT